MGTLRSIHRDAFVSIPELAQLGTLQQLQFDPGLMGCSGSPPDMAPLTALTRLSVLALKPAPPLDIERVQACLHLECLTQLVCLLRACQAAPAAACLPSQQLRSYCACVGSDVLVCHLAPPRQPPL